MLQGNLHPHQLQARLCAGPLHDRRPPALGWSTWMHSNLSEVALVMQGLAWLSALHRQGLNGILADDMGLGKTIQVCQLLLQP